MECQSNQMQNLETETKQKKPTSSPLEFRHQFEGKMTMLSDAETVQEYLDAHQGWFVRCASPMEVEPIGENSYALTVGRFGALGFELEPKLGVELLPENNGVYRMETVPIERNDAHLYEVDYQAELQLAENPEQAEPKNGDTITEVEWTLDLGVAIYFPQFVYRFPKPVIRRTGNRVLAQIVRQVSRRLTYKVQQDFHHTYNLPLPN